MERFMFYWHSIFYILNTVREDVLEVKYTELNERMI